MKDLEFCGAVTVGERGQVVIPANIRQDLKINPGDKLLVLGGKSGRIVFVKSDELTKFLSKAKVKLSAIEKAVAESEKSE